MTLGQFKKLTAGINDDIPLVVKVMDRDYGPRYHRIIDQMECTYYIYDPWETEPNEWLDKRLEKSAALCLETY